jgi:hypothetical protein
MACSIAGDTVIAAAAVAYCRGYLDGLRFKRIIEETTLDGGCNLGGIANSICQDQW